MTELSPHARAACDALRADRANDLERERVRARLSALGVVMSVGAGAALATGSASAAALTTTASASVPAAALTNVSGSALGYGTGALSAKGAVVGAAGASKLLGVPVAIKAGLALLAVTSALAAPRLFRVEPAARPALQERDQAAASSAKSGAARRGAENYPRSQQATPTVQRAASTHSQASLRRAPATTPTRKPSAAPARATLAAKESTLAAESALLESALSALRAGRAERARDLLLRHEQTYGAHALLARERERMRGELSHLLR